MAAATAAGQLGVTEGPVSISAERSANAATAPYAMRKSAAISRLAVVKVA
jgi:hypothetical protein